MLCQPMEPTEPTEPTEPPVTGYLPNGETEHQLFRAFNPDRQIRNRTPLEKLNSKLPSGTNYSDDLTTEERIAESAFIRRKLLVNLNGTDFKVIQLFYQQFQIATDTQLAIQIFTPLTQLVTRNAKLQVNNCNQTFASLVVLSTAWNTNLFRRRQWGPTDRYYYPMSATRKRRRINAALEEMRVGALQKATKILLESEP
ncbi:hypothetical protein [Endozoicomonas sp.]|uniref:hypothetical protein n=1 Tax=Endozoicomonas sp. TaxID=1892382 RepID=UPI00383A3D8C